MTEIGFYHLTRSPLSEALPRLLARTLAIGQRALVVGRDTTSLDMLSQALWENAAWLPHGTPADGDAPLQPIWLTTDTFPANGARYLFLTDGREPVDLDAYDRVFDLFDGTDQAAVAAARRRWTASRQAGHTLSYWQQTEGGWQKKG
jgi:DNA polymerase-3 subunit chi